MNNTTNCNQDSCAPATAAAPYESQALQSFIHPKVNIYETKAGYTLEADLPGVTKEGLQITLEESTLTISGRRAKSALSEVEPLYRESTTADYRRVFELDPAIDANGIVAKLDQGVLTLTLPKTERAKPRKIAIAD